MTQTARVEKDTLLNDMRKGYSDFDTLLASLNEQQMLAEGNDGWSIKNHIAHLTAWQQRTLNVLQAIANNVELPDPTPDMTIDQINEQFHQRDVALPLERVLVEHRAMQQQMLNAVQSMSEDDLNRPISWLDDRSVIGWVIGNTYEHYEEHTHYIQERLQNNTNQ